MRIQACACTFAKPYAQELLELQDSGRDLLLSQARQIIEPSLYFCHLIYLLLTTLAAPSFSHAAPFCNIQVQQQASELTNAAANMPMRIKRIDSLLEQVSIFGGNGCIILDGPAPSLKPNDLHVQMIDPSLSQVT